MTERRAVRSVASASMLFAAGVAFQAATQGSGSTDAFHQIGPGSALENGIVALLYAALLLRERRVASSRS